MPKVSIILVHYGPEKILADCIKSIRASKPKNSYEIIVIDNNGENRGYAKGNNLGVMKAKGKYVFILNPDTKVQKGTIDKLVKFLSANKKAGVVSPTLTDKMGQNYDLQGTKLLTPLKGLFALSFLNKLFPENPVSKNYWLKGIDRKRPYEVDVVPGTAFMITKTLFEKLGGFDEHFFLYFEEADFCKKVLGAGYKNFILPDAKLIHYWNGRNNKANLKDFNKSRFYYFKKNFGYIWAVLVEIFAGMNINTAIFFAIMALGIFLRFYKLEQNLVFNGEMGYDYTTIKTLVDNRQIPLIGPRTSHEWFFIGPLFYWIFAILLPIFNWNVVSGAVFMAFVGVASIYAGYIVISKLFGGRAGLISSFLIAISPLWVGLSKDARFNSVTALLFFPFYFLLIKSLENRGKSLFWLGVILGVMFSFFPSPILLLPAAVVTLFLYRKKIDKKYLLSGVAGLIIPNIPYLVYNAIHKFEILINLFSWIPYRILGFLGLYPKNTADTFVLKQNILSLYNFFQTSWIYNNNLLVLMLFIAVLVFVVRNIKGVNLKVLLIIFAVGYFGLFLHGNPPQHYYLIVFPVPIILLALFLDWLWDKYKFIGILILGSILIGNMTYYFSDKWFYVDATKVSADGYFVPYGLQRNVADYIVREADGKPIAIKRVGTNDKFDEDFSLNYQYLIKLGGGKIDKGSKFIFTIYEDTAVLPKNVNAYWISNIAIVKK